MRVAGLMTHSHNLISGFGTAFSGVTADDSEVLKNPRFVDLASGDLRLDAGSPAINAGLDVSSYVADDFDGTTRPMYKVFEIGAHEYANPGGSVRILKWTEKK